MNNELIRIARLIEGLKKECSADPESAQAIRNGQYMSIAYMVRALAATPESSNSPASNGAAQGAMGDVLDRFKLAEILEQLDVHRKTGAATLAETLFKAIEKYLVKVAQPTDATAQLMGNI